MQPPAGSSVSSSSLLLAARRCRSFTTAGIVVVLAVETIEFLREVPIVEFLTGTEWTPLFANRHFGVLPLVAGHAARVRHCDAGGAAAGPAHRDLPQ